mmetsp:Transcript_22202/g.50759  ORF Transcript_22202/g.50759 Transcript_22202/m.50759 type:complete len:337 (-) Transcript_22202:197-1207(-)
MAGSGGRCCRCCRCCSCCGKWRRTAAVLGTAICVAKLFPDWKVRLRMQYKRLMCLSSRGAALDGSSCELRARLWQPSTRPYKLGMHKPGSHASQYGQDAWVDRVLNGSRGLFVVESGAFDGEFFSNSLFLETARDWQCLLVEANPYLIGPILARRRRCHVFGGGLSITGSVESFRFRPRQAFGGFEETLTVDHEKEWQNTANLVRGGLLRRVALGLVAWLAVPFALDIPVNVTSFPLVSLLHELGRDVVDYWSLDTEGSELRILEHIDFSRVEFGIISVETRKEPLLRARLAELLGPHGIEHVGSLDIDDFFASRRYFQRRGLAFPALEEEEEGPA